MEIDYRLQNYYNANSGWNIVQSSMQCKHGPVNGKNC